jgi:acyl dehydratase
MVAGDYNPIHYDQKTVEKKGFEKLIVHGMYLYCWVYQVAETKLQNKKIFTQEAKFSAITWVDEKLKLLCEKKDEFNYKLQIIGADNDEIKCSFVLKLEDEALIQS